MNEATLIQRINNKVRCFAWKIHTTTHNGRLDCLYAWGLAHLWVEYKYQNRLPKTLDLRKKPFLSAIQQWEIKQLTATKQQSLIVVGTRGALHIFEPKDVDRIHETANLMKRTDQELIDLIHQRTQTPC